MIKLIFSSRNIFILSSALMLILASIACAGSVDSAAPAPPIVESTSQVAQPTQIAAAPAILETRRLTLEFPPKMRAGV
ncbi:MAG TPA: hypothetical protein PLQ94_09995, partial [Anaerolineales bacterium]|nr:hypothetical protein [Anaerolineales bacterium]